MFELQIITGLIGFIGLLVTAGIYINATRYQGQVIK